MANYLPLKEEFYQSLSVSIDEPELEYDDSALELAGDEVLDATTPEVISSTELLNDDDFEKVLGCAHQIVHAQEVVDIEFADIAKSGVLQVGGDDVDGRRVVLFSACRLPSNGTEKVHDRLLRYVRATLDTLVTSDYAIVYLHQGLTRDNRPSFGWLRKAYQELDRKYKKNLKALYIVHPTGWIRIFWTVVRPFISDKFVRKVVYVSQLSELANYVDLSHLEVPFTVRTYDQGVEKARIAKSIAASNDSHFDAAYASWATRGSATTLQQLRTISAEHAIPSVVEDSIAYIRQHGLTVDGIFRRSPAVTDVRAALARYRRGEHVDFSTFKDGVNVAAAALKTFLRELSEPVCTFQLFDEVVRIGMLCDSGQLHGAALICAAQSFVGDKLPNENYDVLQFVCLFLREVADHADCNQMHAANLAIVFGPNLVWSRTPMQSLLFVRPINTFMQLLISEAGDIFVKDCNFA